MKTLLTDAKPKLETLSLPNLAPGKRVLSRRVQIHVASLI